MDVMVIGIAGGTGSGKTTLTNRLKEHFGDDVSVIYHDNYYKRHDEMPYEERCLLNYDHPDAFDTDLMTEHLLALKAGKAIHCPVYDYTIHNRSAETIEVRPAKVIIVEGILIFQNCELRSLMDIKIFVDTDADVRILRRIMRDVKKRGRSLDSVVEQYLTTVKPMHEQFVEPSKRAADIIVLEGGRNLVALDMIIQRVTSHIDGKPSQEPLKIDAEL
ncbi:uridine kinase [Pygmaiobacter massiliensis]|uniref:uridine kinase n=1 Tax=Pygmaiobacter massiliensis TaxID=1917873 RepID=UPI000C7DCE5F|nr:uridine kinase [Pygmaiobacter massiliensis]